MRNLNLAIFFISFIWITSSCELINPDEEIPSYFHIDSASLVVTSSTQGTNRSNISDIWVNIDGNRQGIYEIPATFPLLETGNRNVMFRAGIKRNGIASDRAIYPFYNTITFDTLILPDTIMYFNPVFTYNDATVFEWKENFEDAGLSLSRTSKSDTCLYIQADTNNTSNHYGIFYLDDTRTDFQYLSIDSFVVPMDGSAVYLEMEYQNTNNFFIGIRAIKYQQAVESTVINLFPHPNDMNKIYINLTYEINDNSDAIAFGIFVAAQKDDDVDNAYVKLDNIKLLHF